MWRTNSRPTELEDAPPGSARPRTPGSPGGLWVNPFGSDGIFARAAEYIPFVNGGIQRIYEYTENEDALGRARQRNPVGPDGYLTQAAERIPIVNSVVQEAHRYTGEQAAFERARGRNPIGSDGYVTKVVEHIPIFSDGVMYVHTLQGNEGAAERARTHSLTKLLSKDGAITRLAELLPVSNLFVAAMHELYGNRDEAIRAIDLLASWSQAMRADGLFTKVAELLPGVDAVAFAIHVQSGYYAQAIRSITKVAWVNLEIEEVSLQLACVEISGIFAKNLEVEGLDIIPRQLSLLVGMSDMLTNFLREDKEGQRRPLRMSMERLQVEGNTMEFTKELLKAVLDEKIKGRIEELTQQVPAYSEWLVEILNDYVPEWRRRHLAVRVLSPKRVAPMPAELVEEVQKAFPACSVIAGELLPPAPPRTKRRGSLLPEASAGLGCLAGLGCVAAGAKVGVLALAGGAVAGAYAASKAMARRACRYMEEWNAESWENVVGQAQPELPAWVHEEEAAAASRGKRLEQSVNPDPSAGSSATGPGEARCKGAPKGMYLEARYQDVRRVAPLMRRWYFEEVLKGSLRGALLRCMEPAVRGCMRGVLETETGVPFAGETGHTMPLVFEVELEPWEVELADFSFNLRLPAMRVAFVLQLSWENGQPIGVRWHAVLPEALLDNVARCLRAQMQTWDLRELDPRFQGFTAPVHAAFDFGLGWTNSCTLQLVARNLRSRLSLPD